MFTGFSPEEQNIIESWSKNRPSEFGEGFSVGNSIQVGRLVEIEPSYLAEEDITVKELIIKAREYRGDFEDYIASITETRFFYNEKLDCIFSVGINETDLGLAVSITRILFPVFFKMVDKGKLRAYLGLEEEGEEVPENEIELVEVGFLSRYLVCNYINDNSVFLIEGSDFKEFQKILRFIRFLGDKIGWTWYEDKGYSEDKENDSSDYFSL